MTGILSNSTQRQKFLDTPQEYYAKIRDSVQSFSVVQVGICTFEWNEEDKKYVLIYSNLLISIGDSIATL
jgi:hypothetical protein